MSKAGAVRVTTRASLRANLLAGLDGAVLEIGPGSGANLGYYRDTVRWIGVEPNVSRHERLRHRAAQLGLRARILNAVPERIDLPDESVDAVVGTLVLCSVDDQARALAEVRRVLKPSGR
jgi:ubiquinone/menaquinone biosynthesis C-methylase UbiE